MASLTSSIADAVEAEIAASATNPLPNSVIHATADLDIRIQSIEKESDQRARPVPSQGSLTPDATTKPVDDDDDAGFKIKAQTMGQWWGKSISKNMDLPEGYAEVAVLLIRWTDELDTELNTREETEELEALFCDRFGYNTKTVELNVRHKPQHQLNSCVSEFIRDHDGPHNLLIVYYTGHGRYPEREKYLELTATRSPSPGNFSMDAKVNWNRAEDQLQHPDVEADVLTILDTCYSSNHVKASRQYTKKCELLSACMWNQTTSSPGDYSFTRALIDAILGTPEQAGLLGTGEHAFSTFTLSQRINLNERRKDQPCGIWDRGEKKIRQGDSHIYLVPLTSANVRALKQALWRTLPKAYLTLRFGLKDKLLSQDQIEFMTATLAREFNSKAKVKLRNIDWIKMEPAPPITHFQRVGLVLWVVGKWKKVVERKKEKRTLAQQTLDKSITPACAMEQVSSETSVPQSPLKRGLEDAEIDVKSKRRHLGVDEPPSPPVSNSSYIDIDV